MQGVIRPPRQVMAVERQRQKANCRKAEEKEIKKKKRQHQKLPEIACFYSAAKHFWQYFSSFNFMVSATLSNACSKCFQFQFLVLHNELKLDNVDIS